MPGYRWERRSQQEINKISQHDGEQCLDEIDQHRLDQYRWLDTTHLYPVAGSR